MCTEFWRRNRVTALMSRPGIEAIVLSMKLSSALTVGAAMVLLSGCSGAAVDKQGAPAVTVLRIGVADPQEPELAYFVGAIDRLSDHRLRAEVDPTTYFSETPGGEARLVGDLRSGKVGFGFVPSRDWADAGDPGFQAVQAPFVISTTAAAATLTASPAAGDLLRGLDSANVVGLGLVAGEARRLIARKPITGAGDLAGTRVRINDNHQAAQLMSALGATAVQRRTADQTKTDLASGDIDAVESSPFYASANSYNNTAPYVSSFGMFPKLQVIVAGKDAWAKLDPAAQQALQAAATDTVTHAVGEIPARDARELSLLCTNGAVIVQPGPTVLADLAARATAATPTDATTRQLMDQISATVTGAGVQPLATPVPAPCRVATTAAQAQSLHEDATQQTTSQQTTNQVFPTGTFEVTVTAAQWAAAGQIGPDWNSDITFTWTLTPDGTLTETQQPDFPDQGPIGGTYVVKGNRVTLSFRQVDTDFVDLLQWSYFQGELRFTVVAVQDDASRVIYAQPWRKVA